MFTISDCVFFWGMMLVFMISTGITYAWGYRVGRRGE